MDDNALAPNWVRKRFECTTELHFRAFMQVVDVDDRQVCTLATQPVGTSASVLW